MPGNKIYLFIISGKKGFKFDDVQELKLSPDGKKFAYVAKEYGKYFVVLNGKKGSEFDEVYDLKYHPKERCFVYLAQRGKKIYLVKQR